MKAEFFNLDSYRKTIGLPADTILSPDFDCLCLLVKLHAATISYQNLHLHAKNKKALSLSGPDFQDRVQKHGGCCYETSNLLFFALLAYGFQVKIIPTVVLNNSPYNPMLPSAHNILLVILDKMAYLVDVGFSYNSLYEPIPFNLKKINEDTIFSEVITQSNDDTYQLQCKYDYCQLNMMIQNKWFSFYRFPRPLQPISQEQTLKNYWNLLSTTMPIPIRDKYIKIGKVEENGSRVGFHYERVGDSFYAFKFQSPADSEQKFKHEYKELSQLNKDIQAVFHFQIPDELLRKPRTSQLAKNREKFFQTNSIILKWNEGLSARDILLIKNFFVKSYIIPYAKCASQELAIDPHVSLLQYFNHEFDSEMKKLSRRKEEGIQYLIARHEDHPIAFVSCQLNKKSGRVYVRWAVINAAFQRCGLGERMFKAVAKHFPESRGMELYTRGANIASRQFYQKNGFTAVDKFIFFEPKDSKTIPFFVRGLFGTSNILYPPADEAFDLSKVACFSGFVRNEPKTVKSI